MKKLAKIIIPLMLTGILFTPTGIALAAATEIYYDDGKADVMARAGLEYTYIVRFTPPSTPVTLTQVQVYCTGSKSSPEILPGHRLKVHVFNESKTSIYSRYCEITQGWNSIGLSPESLPTIENDFYVGFEFVESYYPYIGVDTSSPDNRSFKAGSPSGTFTLKDPAGDYMIRATVEPVVIEPASVIDVGIDVDIKPGSEHNSINLKSKGVIPVAILTTESFDASTVNSTSVMFEGASAVHCAIEDMDDDGDLDMILHFSTQEVGLIEGDTEASITGKNMDGISIHGTDSVSIISPEVKGKIDAPGQNKE